MLNTAQDWDDFRAGAALFGAPAQNLIYADLEGNIGYQAPGVIPIREGYDGKWPIPGWDSRYQWKGTIPFTALPSVLNPDEGWIVTANQAVIGPDYPFFITDDWSYGARSQRIVDLIEEATAGRRQHRRQPDAADPDGLGHRAGRVPGTPARRAADARTRPLTPSACSTGGTSRRVRTRPPRPSSTRSGGRWSRACSTRRPTPSSSAPAAATATGRSIKDIWDSPDDFWWDDKTVDGDAVA